MLNSDPVMGASETRAREDAAVKPSLRSNGRGAAVLVGLATAVVVAIWFAFYLLVFVPRAVGP